MTEPEILSDLREIKDLAVATGNILGAMTIASLVTETIDKIENPGDYARPLFIPLKTKWFEQFRSGEKRSEIRLYGPRWNERTCRIGRRVVLSKGYGKTARLEGTICDFYRRRGDTFGSTYQAAIRETFGSVDVEVAEIRITLDTGDKGPL